MMNETVQSIMIRNVITLHPADSLAIAKDLFMNKRIHHLPVVEDGKLVGLITTYDLWKKDIKMSDYDKINVRDVMSINILKLSPEDKVGTAAELFLDNRFHALPIVENGLLVGLVTSFDVLKYEFRKEYPQPILFQEVFEEEYAVAS
ncbi:MAG: CBS domain-containing protein [Saprospiraceae bacterium]|nr:CBS domain-containing protein [Saprospiraceae bacterium]